MVKCLLTAAALCGATLALAGLEGPPVAAAQPSGIRDHVIFSINVQDFSHPEESAAIVRKILDTHEQYAVPVDFYLTTTMTDLFEAKAPDVLRRLKSSAVAAVSYHVRPPTPYHTRYDWAGLGESSAAEQREAILRHETHGLSLATGKPTSQPGGYAKLKDLLGYAPYVVSPQADPTLASTAITVSKELGARFLVAHGRAANLGEQRAGLYLRPEQVDLLLFEHIATPTRSLPVCS